MAAPRRGIPFRGRRRLPRVSSFRGSITRPAHWLSTLRSPGRPGTTQDSLPAAGQALPDGAGYPQGPNERFPLMASPFPKLSWRTHTSTLQIASDDDGGRGRPDPNRPRDHHAAEGSMAGSQPTRDASSRDIPPPGPLSGHRRASARLHAVAVAGGAAG